MKLFFTDASSNGRAGYWGEADSKVVYSPWSSVQQGELFALSLVLQDWPHIPLNIISDSQYAVFRVTQVPMVHLSVQCFRIYL